MTSLGDTNHPAHFKKQTQKKVSPSARHVRRYIGGAEVWRHLLEVSAQLHAPSVLPPVIRLMVVFCVGLFALHRHFGNMQSILTVTELVLVDAVGSTATYI